MPFIQSAGAIQSLSRPSVPAVQKIDLSPWVAMDYFEIWRRQPSVRRTVSFLGRNIAQLGIHMFERRGDTDRKRVTAHPLARLMQQPNRFTTRYRFLNTLVHDFAIYDCAYWWKIKAADGQRKLIHLPAPLVTPKGDNWMTPEEFEFRGTKGARMIPADQIVYFRGYGGISDAGVSPIESLRQVLREDWTASEMRDQIMRNGARHSGFITRPEGAPQWSDDARERFKKDWQTKYAGAMAANGGGTPLLEDGMTFTAASQTAKDLQYIESRKLTDEEVARTYFIPPPMIGILDHATFSNIEEQHQMLYQDTLGPWLSMFQDEIELQLLPEFEPVKPEGFYIEFNLMEKLSGNVEKRDESITRSVGGPWRTINEGRALANMPPVEGGDELIQPLNVTQNGDRDPIQAEEDPKPAMTPTDKPDPEDEDEQED
ncbi:phage portal protein [Mycobacterium sp. NS-7484]|uniref:phage portal protein n=1 Tax=Mycobacterium sp. NS-7484 TaxID=1834161 RepID=UPI00096D8A02|nr:phage portal protein [Mycobacterium sp. NS-7484]OMB98419.1 phage portal protein [Mycobacterium sp. NS-7484]